jgi:hypothetical protein
MDTAPSESRFTGGTLFWRMALTLRQLSEGIVHRLCFALPHPDDERASRFELVAALGPEKAPEVFVL